MKNLSVIVFILLLGISVYLLTIRGSIGNPLTDSRVPIEGQATGPFESSHERAPYALTISLVENGTIALPKKLADFASPDTVFTTDKFFIIFPPGISIAAIPFYLIGKEFNIAQLATFGGMMIFALMNLVLLYFISRKIFNLSVSTSFLTSFIFGFASSSLTYAASLYQHQMTTFLILSAFYAAWLYKKHVKFRWLSGAWVWLNLGLNIWIDLPTIIFMAPVMLYMFLNSISLKKVKKGYSVSFAFIFFIPMVVFILLTVLNGIYNQTNFGSWSRLAQLLTRYDTSQLAKLGKEEVVTRETGKNISGVAKEDLVVKGSYTLSIAPDKGLLFFSPIYLLAIAGIFLAIKKKESSLFEAAILIGVFVINFIFFSSWGDPWGGWAYGPRYLVPSMAVLAFFAAYWLEKTKFQLVGRVIALILIIYSIAVALLGGLTTTTTPPKVEADYLKIKYGYFFNLDFFEQGKTGSFIFKEYLSPHLTFQHFFYLILGFLSVIVFIFLFIPIFTRRKNET